MARVLSERVLVSLALLLAGAALLPAALSQRDAAMGAAFDPAFFPLIVLGGWIACAGLAVLSDLRAAPGPQGGARWGAVLVATLGMLAFALLTPQTGFFLGGALLSLLVLFLSGRFGVLEALAFALAAPGLLVGLFNHVLRMPLPVSPFLWWL